MNDTNFFENSLPVGPMSEDWLGYKGLPAHIKDQWIKDGLCIIRNAYNEKQIEKYNSTVKAVRDKVEDGRDRFGLGERIGQLHQLHPELLELSFNQEILHFLKWILNDDPIVLGSLNFDKGTQQASHVDAIFFYPEPSYSMCGCWVALEDIDTQAGPLFYIPGSHKWQFNYSDDLLKLQPNLKEKRDFARSSDCKQEERSLICAELGNAWCKEFDKIEIAKSTQRVTPILKAGDAVIWHSLLAHGGGNVLNEALSRKSVVFHYIGKRARLFTFEQFMLYSRTELNNQIHQKAKLNSFQGLEYMSYDYFVTYTNNVPTVHTL